MPFFHNCPCVSAQADTCPSLWVCTHVSSREAAGAIRKGKQGGGAIMDSEQEQSNTTVCVQKGLKDWLGTTASDESFITAQAV